MKISVDIPMPAEQERQLRGRTPDLERIAKEALLVELYRLRQITHKDLSQLLGFDRWETDSVLRRHGVEDLTPSDLEDDVNNVRSIGPA